MIEQEVDVKVFVTDFKVVLTPGEGKALAELQQKSFQVADKPGFQLPLVKRLLQGEEVENVGVFQKLTGQVGLWGGQALLKVGNRLSLAFVGVAFDLMPESIAAPALFDGLLHVPETGGKVYDLFDEDDVMEPRNSERKLRGDSGCGKVQ